mmetsp:Transcript_28795/g.69154  ORF Transcript_28795/g.69154 Transcript_28795/m.69154 type:complete len:274 (+) Transcript_28795:955-1776(+)
MHLLDPLFGARDLTIPRQSIDDHAISGCVSVHSMLAHALDPLLRLTGIASSRTALNDQIERRCRWRETGRKQTLHVARCGTSISGLEACVQQSLIRRNIRLHAGSFDCRQPPLSTCQAASFRTCHNGCVVSGDVNLQSKFHDRLNASFNAVSVALPTQSDKHRIDGCDVHLHSAPNGPCQPTLSSLKPTSLDEGDHNLHSQPGVHHTPLVHHLLKEVDSSIKVLILHRDLNHRRQRTRLARSGFTLVRLRSLGGLAISCSFHHTPQQRHSHNY